MTFKWRGKKVLQAATDAVSDALGEIALEVEAGAKDHLWPGHGYDTGSLQRSLHTAPPGYDWSRDHRYPNGPERGGRFTPAVLDGARLHVLIGSGQEYALIVHMKYYAYLLVGLHRGLRAAPRILRKYRIR